MTLVIRLGLAAFAAIELVLGVWTAFFPESFYNDVATVNLTPPFSEHLMRDFGGATIGLAIVLGSAAIWFEPRWAAVALLAYLAYSVPHFVFHLGHLEGAATGDALALKAILAASVVGPIALLGLVVVRIRRDATLRDSALG